MFIRGAVPALSLTSVGGVGSWDQTLATTNQNDPLNKRHTDDTVWAPGDIPAEFIYVHQLVTDASGSGGSFDINVPSQVFVGWRDAATKPAWLDSNWLDTGHDLEGGVVSLFVRSYSAGTVALSSASERYDVFVRAGHASIPSASSPGFIRFAAASYQVDDDAANFSQNILERYGGTDGAASATVTSPDTHGTLITTSAVNWANGEGGFKTVEYNQDDVTGDQTETLTVGTFVGASEGNRSTTDISIRDVGTTPSAQTWYIHPSGAGTQDGTTEANAAPPSFANSIQPVAGGDVTVNWVGDAGDYVGFTLTPQFSGTDATHRIIHQPINANVTIKGPTSGAMDYGIDWGTNGISYVNIARAGGFEFFIDGEGTNQKRVFPSARITFICNIDGANNCEFEFGHHETAGYKGINIINNVSAGNVFRWILGTHGTPYRPFVEGEPSGDFGDWLTVGNTVNGQASNGLWCGEWTDTRVNKHVGHSNRIAAGTWHLRHVHINNNWDDLATFATDDGNRSFEIITRATECCVEDSVFEQAGNAAQDNVNDSQPSAMAKHGGQQNLFRRNFLLDSARYPINQYCSGSNRHMEDVRIYNYTVWKSADAAVEGEHTPSGYAYPMGPFYYYNNIFANITQTNAFRLKFYFPEDGDWENNVFFFNNAIPVGCKLRFSSESGGSDTGWQSIATLESSYPSNFGDNVEIDPNFVNPRVGVNFNNYYADFVPQASECLGTGRHLTTATNTGTTDTILEVADAKWFPIPRSYISASTKGPYAGGWGVFIEGVGFVKYTAVNWTTNQITLDSQQSWSSGAKIYDLTDSPDMGAIQS